MSAPECPVCKDTGRVTNARGQIDACYRCAQRAEAEWQATHTAPKAA